MVYSRRRFGFKERSIDRLVTNIIPHNDPVPGVDRQGGLVQYIECDEDNPLNCHKMSTTLCRLLDGCGDPRHRLLSPEWLAGGLDHLPPYCQAFDTFTEP